MYESFCFFPPLAKLGIFRIFKILPSLWMRNGVLFCCLICISDLLVRVSILSSIYMWIQILRCLYISYVHVSIVLPVYYWLKECVCVCVCVHKCRLKWVKDLKVRPKTLKFLAENTASNFSDISRSNVFLHMSPEARKITVNVNFWDFIKIKSFCTAKETINKTKRQPTE